MKASTRRLRPLRDEVLLLPESRERARERISRLFVLDGDDELRDGYPEMACRAEILAVGPRVRTGLTPGQVVLMPCHKNAGDTAFETPEGRVILYPEGELLGVFETGEHA